MDKVKELLSKCKASVSITVNHHRDSYMSVKDYVEERAEMDEDLINEIGLDVFGEMQKRDTIVEVQAYPNTPIGSYVVMHYDIDKAIELTLNAINNQ